MERRAASHTEEEEMNQRRRLLNAAKKGDQKAISKLFELYQVRIFSGEMVNKLNRAAGLHRLRGKGAQQKSTKGGPLSKKRVPQKAAAKMRSRPKPSKGRPKPVKSSNPQKASKPKKSKKR
jgi:hypothetical protein